MGRTDSTSLHLIAIFIILLFSLASREDGCCCPASNITQRRLRGGNGDVDYSQSRALAEMTCHSDQMLIENDRQWDILWTPRFGWDVALSGNVLVVGATWEGSGRAYVYTYNGTAWSDETVIASSDRARSDSFGHSVAIDGNTIVVGADYKDFRGSAYVFRFDGVSWNEQKLGFGSAYQGIYGHSVAIDNNTIAIAERGSDRVFIYRFKGASFEKEQDLVSGTYPKARFGASVAITGDTMVIGAPWAYANERVGSASVYHFNSTSWEFHSKIWASDGADDAYFGGSVAICDRDTIVIGAPTYAPSTVYSEGKAYTFRRTENEWQQDQILTASDGSAGNFFGHDVACFGSTVVIGAPKTFSTLAVDVRDRKDYGGRVYIFENDASGGWTEQRVLSANETSSVYNSFGHNIALNDRFISVGAWRERNQKGSVYTFCSPGPCWPSPCVHGRCEIFGDTHLCTCDTGWTGVECDQDINECEMFSPCLHGDCTNTDGSYMCSCNDGWTGRNCDQDADECKMLSPCLHGICTNTDGSYMCGCDAGWTGMNCTESIKNCDPDPCSTHGICRDLIHGYECDCDAGWTGMNCTESIKNCDPDPCSTHGICRDLIYGYECVCDPGWSGKQCAIETSRNASTAEEHQIAAVVPVAIVVGLMQA
uniref:EGF-like domain-containing protein n=1 Tax=Amphora coffeiformis TaxID=265554 RepID=A0A7S3P3H6_9STRA|eukprot:scaffold1060_cov196-Amphora_coffeaeformis.AAC.18